MIHNYSRVSQYIKVITWLFRYGCNVTTNWEGFEAGAQRVGSTRQNACKTNTYGSAPTSTPSLFISSTWSFNKICHLHINVAKHRRSWHKQNTIIPATSSPASICTSTHNAYALLQGTLGLPQRLLQIAAKNQVTNCALLQLQEVDYWAFLSTFQQFALFS